MRSDEYVGDAADAAASFHFLTVGASSRLVSTLWDRIAQRSGFTASHIVHPTYDCSSWPKSSRVGNVYFFRDDLRTPMPPADASLLAYLELPGVPTIHNMILGDRVVSKLEYAEALSYATYLARRLFKLYQHLRPDVVIGDFDALHSAIGLAVAKSLEIPWFALNFSTIPSGHVALCSGLTPATAVTLELDRGGELADRAAEVFESFRSRKARAPAYIPPSLLSPSFAVKHAPLQARALVEVFRRRKLRSYRKYSDYRNSYSVTALFHEAIRLRKNLLLMPRHRLLRGPYGGRYAFIGLHMQPEASIDVFAHFFSNQLRVIELISRSLPPTHALLVKLHKSDVPNYSRTHLEKFKQFPGVKLVAPEVDTYELIKGADVIFAIQGTIALEAALLGRPVIVFGESPTLKFPSVTPFGRPTELPALVRAKLAEPEPKREQLLAALVQYLTPFYPASHNDWDVAPTDRQIDGYVRLFHLLARYIARNASAQTLEPVTAAVDRRLAPAWLETDR